MTKEIRAGGYKMNSNNRVRGINVIFLFTIFSYIIGSTIIAFISELVVIDHLLLLLLSQGMLVLPTVCFLAYHKINVFEQIRFKKIHISTVFLLIVFAICIMPLMNLINAVSMLFAANKITDTITSIVDYYPLLVSIVVIAVVPAVLEETVYRGVFYNEYRKNSVLKGIILSGFLFGLLHMNINQFSYAFIMGIIFALVIEATDSILSTMIIHFVINSYSVIIAYLLPTIIKILSRSGDSRELSERMSSQELSKEELLTSIATLAIPAVIMTVIAFLLYYVIAKKEGRWEKVKGIFKKSGEEEISEHLSLKTDRINSQEDKKKGLITLPLLVSFLICVTFMVLNEIH